jgi:hypothetical protein
MVMAQPPRGGAPRSGEGRQMMEEKRERLKALSVAYLTKELELTSAEAEKFWPVHNRYTEELRSELRKSMENGKTPDVLERQQRMLDIRKKYQQDFQKILSPERTQKLFSAEMKFQDQVRKELENRRAQRPTRSFPRQRPIQ